MDQSTHPFSNRIPPQGSTKRFPKPRDEYVTDSEELSKRSLLDGDAFLPEVRLQGNCAGRCIVLCVHCFACAHGQLDDFKAYAFCNTHVTRMRSVHLSFLNQLSCGIAPADGVVAVPQAGDRAVHAVPGARPALVHGEPALSCGDALPNNKMWTHVKTYST